MPLFSKLRQYLSPGRRGFAPAGQAYDRWALSYDHQPDNLMLALDEQVCSALLEETEIGGRVIADIGCGTGRHWKKIQDRSPGRLLGYDVSAGMLRILNEKYPQAETRLLENDRLTDLGDGSCDLILSTLTVAHIRQLEAALTEWNRVLRPGGEIIITDYHPDALARGGKRTFRDGSQVIAIRNYIHPLRKIQEITAKLRLSVVSLTEKKIDDSMKPYYEHQNALPVFERFRGVPIIYGIHLKKADAPA